MDIAKQWFTTVKIDAIEIRQQKVYYSVSNSSLLFFTLLVNYVDNLLTKETTK